MTKPEISNHFDVVGNHESERISLINHGHVSGKLSSPVSFDA